MFVNKRTCSFLISAFRIWTLGKHGTPHKRQCKVFYCTSFCLQPQDMKARTLPRMTALQMGQWRRLAAQSPHTTRWPQGMKTMDTSLSMHTLQVLSSCSCLSSSSGLGSFTVGGGQKWTDAHLKKWQTSDHFIRTLTSDLLRWPRVFSL